MAGHAGGFAGDTLHGTAITKEAVGVVIDEVVARLVEDGSGVSLGNSKTNGVGKALAQGTGGDLNTRGIVGLGMARGNAVELLEDDQVRWALQL